MPKIVAFIMYYFFSHHTTPFYNILRFLSNKDFETEYLLFDALQQSQ